MTLSCSPKPKRAGIIDGFIMIMKFPAAEGCERLKQAVLETAYLDEKRGVRIPFPSVDRHPSLERKRVDLLPAVAARYMPAPNLLSGERPAVWVLV